MLAELQQGGYAVTSDIGLPDAGLESSLQKRPWDVVIIGDCGLQNPPGLVLRRVKQLAPEFPVIVILEKMEMALAASLINQGAAECISDVGLPLLPAYIGRDLQEAKIRRQAKQAQEEQRVSEEKFIKAFNNSPDAIHITRLSDGVYLAVNHGFEKLVGYRADEVLGKSSLEVGTWVHPEERERLSRILLEKGILEIPFIESCDRYGRIFPSRGTFRTMEINGELCVISFVRDISDEVKAREVILQRNRELQVFSQMTTAVTTSLNVPLILEKALHGALEITGLQKGVFYLPVTSGGEKFYLAAAEGFSPQELERRKDGGLQEVKISAGQPIVLHADPGQPLTIQPGFFEDEKSKTHAVFPLILQDKPGGCISLWADEEYFFSPETIEQVHQLGSTVALALENAHLYEAVQKYADELEERVAERTNQLMAVNQELEAFSYTIAHDLRAPLRTIHSFSGFLREDHVSGLDAEGLHLLTRIETVAANMQAMIDDLLSLSKLTKKEIVRQLVDLSSLSQSIADELQKTEPQRQVTWHITPGIFVRADRMLLTTALENLIGNAWKFTAYKPEACIDIGILPDKKNARKHVYFVRDNGAGFDPQLSKNLFQVFKRLHNSDEFSGTGIGLASVKRIIHRHGGRVWAEGAPQQGATFYFSLGE